MTNGDFNKNRIFKNSALLYVRMLFTMWLNLCTTRLVLKNLGVEDMGVFGVVGSITTLFTVFVGAVTTTIQRYLTFELGKKNGRPNIMFCSSINVIFILCAGLLILLEVGGLWMLHHKVNIPVQSMDAAFWVYQLSILACLVNIISIPYNSLMIAHEKMDTFAAISILQVILTCAGAYSLSFFDNGRLLIYAILCAGIGITIRIIYQIYCHRMFEESRYHIIIDKGVLRSMAKFMGINAVSSILNLIASQGVVFVINWTLGVAYNAVYSIAQQLRNMVISFAYNVQRAIAPQITKTYASGDMIHHKKLVFGGSKLQVYMVFFIMIPFLFRTEYIMRLWLGDVPAHAVFFAQCSIFASLAYAMLEPIRTAVYATSRIGRFNIIPDSLFVLVLPISYIVSKTTLSADWMMFSVVATEFMAVLLRIWFATKVGTITLRETIQNVAFPCVVVAIMSGFFCYWISSYFSQDIIGLLSLLVLNSVVLCIIIVLFGTNHKEKKLMINMGKRIFLKLTNLKFT